MITFSIITMLTYALIVGGICGGIAWILQTIARIINHIMGWDK